MSSAVSVKSRETRLGIVMYGGVSLAVYINGICQELFRAVRGDGFYQVLKSLIDSDIVVDIISGTSAGGINGLMLGFALANNYDFSRTKELWQEHGDLQRLLQQIDLEPDQYKSLLNSDGYYRAKLADAFRSMAPCRKQADCPSPIKELDVFVTGTAINANVYTTVDDAGRTIDLKDYRNVFRLKHRQDRPGAQPFRAESDDKEVVCQALAKLARLTSCFPGAFLPVEVRIDGEPAAHGASHSDQYRDDKVDQKLAAWGKLTKSNYYLDGGVLDNKPFTPTLEAIFGRTAERDVDRILFYVEPDPEEPTATPSCEPTFLSAALDGVFGISTYQSITEDAKAVENHNAAVLRYMGVCHKLQGQMATKATGVVIPDDLPETQKTVYANARNTQLSTRALLGILRDAKTGAEPHLTNRSDRDKAHALVDSLKAERVTGDLSFNETFERFDVYFRLRRLYHTVGRMRCDLYRRNKAPANTENLELMAGLNRHIKLLEIVQYWFEYILDRSPVQWQDSLRPDQIWHQVQYVMESFLGLSENDRDILPNMNLPAGERLSPIALQLFHEGLRKRAASKLKAFETALRQDVDTAPHGAFYGLLQWTDEAERQFLQDCPHSSGCFREEYLQYVNLDALVFPLEFLSNLKEKDPIRLVRMSPVPTGNGFWKDEGPKEKLAGWRLAHFSGFLKRSWRSNDILWGRLDGVRTLAETLFTTEVIAKLQANPDLRRRAADCFFEANGRIKPDLDRIFAHSPEGSRDELKQYMRELLLQQATTPDSKSFAEILNLLIEMAQLEILHEEVPQVLEDAALQQAEWNQFKMGDAQNGQKTKFASPTDYIDPALATVAALNTVEEAKAFWNGGCQTAGSPKETKLGEYFENDYTIASETLETGLPSLTAAGLITHTLLVVNNCILGALAKPVRKKIESNPIFKLGVTLPLRLSHQLIALWSRAPKTVAIVNAAVTAMALILLVMAAEWYDPILESENVLHINWIAVTVVLPLLALGIQAFMLRGVLKTLFWIAAAVSVLAGILCCLERYILPLATSWWGTSSHLFMQSMLLLFIGLLGFLVGARQKGTRLSWQKADLGLVPGRVSKKATHLGSLRKQKASP